MGLIFHPHPVFRVRTGLSTQIQRRTRCPHDPRRGHGLESGWVKVCMRVFVCVCVCVCVRAFKFLCVTPRPPGGRLSDIQTFSSQTQLITSSPGVIKKQKTVSVSLSQIKLNATDLLHHFSWPCGCLDYCSVATVIITVFPAQWFYGSPFSIIIFKGPITCPVVCNLLKNIFTVFAQLI